MVKFRQQKDSFKTADFRHFSLNHINFFFYRFCLSCKNNTIHEHDELFSMFQNCMLLFLFFPSRSEILNCIKYGLFINPLKGQQITLWQHKLLGEGSNWIFETKVKCFVDTKGQYQLLTTGAYQLTTSGLTLAKLITFVHITQPRKMRRWVNILWSLMEKGLFFIVTSYWLACVSGVDRVAVFWFLHVPGVNYIWWIFWSESKMLFFLQPLQQHETFSTRTYLFLRHANQRGPKCQPTHHHG